MEKLYGRQEERKLLNEYYGSGKSEFVAIYGRRRVGKTFLIKQHFNNSFDFYMSGTIGGDKKNQLLNFWTAMKEAGCEDVKMPNNWSDAFFILQNLLESKIEKGKRCLVFIDEISSLDTPKSGFIGALDHFWNTWAVDNQEVMLIVCGSATSWIIDNIIDNYGGLHNRITHEMYLAQFSLHETEEFLNENGFVYDRYMICQLYMVLGGIPYYLSLLDRTKSVAQNIDNLFFGRSSQLRNEFDRLFKSLFRNADPYMQVIECLASNNSGMTRDEIAQKTGLVTGAKLTGILKDLENCDFIRKFRSRGKSLQSKNQIYQIIDMFTLFYYRFCRQGTTDNNFWMNSINTPIINNWAGIAFEHLCFLHIDKIKKAIGIDKIHTEYYSWRSKESTPKCQIDMIIERADRLINICEIKYCDMPYNISKEDDMKMRVRMGNFKSETNSKCGLLVSYISPFGLSNSKYNSLVVNVITLDDLFC